MVVAPHRFTWTRLEVNVPDYPLEELEFPTRTDGIFSLFFYGGVLISFLWSVKKHQDLSLPKPFQSFPECQIDSGIPKSREDRP